MATRITEKDTVRVTVSFGRHRMDVSLPLHTPIESWIASLAATLAESISESSGSAREHEWITQPKSRYILSPQVSTTPYPREKSLREVGVIEGSHLLFSVEDRNERFEVLIDDLAEAGAEDLAARYASWGKEESRRFAGFALPLATAILAVGLGFGPALVDFGPWQWACVLLQALVMAVCCAAAVTVSVWDTGRASLIVPLTVSAYLSGAGVALAAIPEGLGRWHVVCVGAVMVILGGMFIITVRQPLSLHYAVMVSGLVGVLASLIAFGSNLEPYQLAMIAAAVAFLVMRMAGGIGLRWAGVERPHISAAGEDLVVSESIRLVEISRSVSSDAKMSSVVNQTDRAIDYRNIVLGVITGTPLVAAVAALTAMATSNDGNVLILCLILSAVFMIRGTWFDDAVQRGFLTGGGMVIMLGTMVGAVINDDMRPEFVVAAAAGFFLTIVTTSVWSWRGGKPMSPASRKFAEIFESMLGGSIPVMLFFILELWSAVRHS